MKIKRAKRQEFTTISIPSQLFEKIEQHIDNTGFPSVSSYVAFILRVLISDSGKKSKADYEAKIIRKKLEELGYS